MYEVVGWLGTLLVLVGYWLNAKQYHKHAMYVWIFGDVCWITYDIYRGIYPHLTLGIFILTLNLYGIHNILKTKKCSETQNTHFG